MKPFAYHSTWIPTNHISFPALACCKAPDQLTSNRPQTSVDKNEQAPYIQPIC
jgi:hypothetical protein